MQGSDDRAGRVGKWKWHEAEEATCIKAVMKELKTF